MGLHHRKLIREICQTICHVDESGSCSSSDCEVCFKICLTNPLYPYYSPPPPPPPPLQAPPFSLDENANQGNHRRISTYLILTLAFLAAAFFVVCIRAIYTRLGNRREPVQEIEETHDDFLNEEHGPIVDHPIWYIRTPGLQQSIINAITVCKYKKGEGLIEGTECSVCLSEFQEDESLRLLPKCNHAFHLRCIDTWLGSHTNCPLCRAPIVTNPTRIPSLESVVVDSSSFENSQMEILENRGETETETSGGMGNRAADSELRNRVEEEGEMEVGDGERICEAESQVAEGVSIRPRRSVSLDFSSVADINFALATFLSVESGGHSKRVLGGGNNYPSVSKGTGNDNLSAISRGGFSFRSARYLQGAPSSMRRTHSYNGKYLLPWYGRSQRKQNVPL